MPRSPDRPPDQQPDRPPYRPGSAAPSATAIARLHAAWRQAAEVAQIARQSALLAIGVPDYDAYVQHRQAEHPDQPVMSYAEFFRERQDARYGRGSSRCC